MDQFDTSMGHSMDHIIEALKETFGNTEAEKVIGWVLQFQPML